MKIIMRCNKLKYNLVRKKRQQNTIAKLQKMCLFLNFRYKFLIIRHAWWKVLFAMPVGSKNSIKECWYLYFLLKTGQVSVAEKNYFYQSGAKIEFQNKVRGCVKS